MALTIEDLKSLDLGYLQGDDLIQFCSPQILIKQYEVDNECLESGCRLAYSEIQSNLSNRYDITAEFLNRTTAREQCLVKISTLIAINNICGNLSGLPENLKTLIKWANDEIIKIRARLTHLELIIAKDSVVSNSAIISDGFNYLG